MGQESEEYMRRDISAWSGHLASVVFCLAALLNSAEAAAQVRDFGCSPTVANPCTGGGTTTRPGSPSPSTSVDSGVDVALRREALALNDEAIQWAKGGDWEKAVELLEAATAKSPADPIIKDNLTRVRAVLSAQRTKQATAADAAQQALKELSRSMAAPPPSTGGLDFDGGTAAPARTGGNAGLDFLAGAPMPAAEKSTGIAPSAGAVAATPAPSPLPQGVQRAISDVFSNTPPGVSDRIRLGFEAVMKRDWTLAKGWFGDALLHDPGNDNIQRLIDAVNAPVPARPAPRTTQPEPQPTSNEKALEAEVQRLRDLLDYTLEQLLR